MQTYPGIRRPTGTVPREPTEAVLSECSGDNTAVQTARDPWLSGLLGGDQEQVEPGGFRGSERTVPSPAMAHTGRHTSAQSRSTHDSESDPVVQEGSE